MDFHLIDLIKRDLAKILACCYQVLLFRIRQKAIKGQMNLMTWLNVHVYPKSLMVGGFDDTTHLEG